MNSPALTKMNLAEITIRINDEWSAAEEDAGKATEHTTSSVYHALNTGQLLTEAKAQVPHGEWESWVKENCPFKSRQARKLMQLSKEWPRIEKANRHSNAVLGIEQALALASESSPDVPDEQPQDGDQHPDGQSDTQLKVSDAANETDALGREIPDHLVPEFETGVKIKSVGTKIEIFVLGEVQKLTELEGGNVLNMDAVKQKLQALKEEVTGAAYFTHCTPCCDDPNPHCERCRGSGFIPESEKGKLPSGDKSGSMESSFAETNRDSKKSATKEVEKI